jgi:hypothetical protein
MGDGWETRRRREPGYDWMIIALGARGEIEKAVIDTAHFKGNFPDTASIQAADLRNFGDGLTDALITDSMFWKELLPQQKLGPDAEHSFRDELIGWAPSPMCASTSSPMAVSRACAFRHHLSLIAAGFAQPLREEPLLWSSDLTALAVLPLASTDRGV